MDWFPFWVRAFSFSLLGLCRRVSGFPNSPSNEAFAFGTDAPSPPGRVIGARTGEQPLRSGRFLLARLRGGRSVLCQLPRHHLRCRALKARLTQRHLWTLANYRDVPHVAQSWFCDVQWMVHAWPKRRHSLRAMSLISILYLFAFL